MYSIHFGLAPLYITELVSTVAAQTSRPGLRSADTTNYVQPRTRTKFAERAFSYAGPAVWNLLPWFTSNTNDKQFQTQLKTYLLSLLLVDFSVRFLITYFDICTAPMFLFL